MENILKLDTYHLLSIIQVRHVIADSSSMVPLGKNNMFFEVRTLFKMFFEVQKRRKLSIFPQMIFDEQAQTLLDPGACGGAQIRSGPVLLFKDQYVEC